MPTINIDGRSFVGRSVSIVNGVVTIDGERQDGTVSGVVEIKITEGVLDMLRCDASVSCAEVFGNVTAGGSVNCAGVGGNVMAGGSVHCDAVSGSLSAAGHVQNR
jgi:hypothetical protein